MGLAPGSKFGSYQISASIGAGGMGEVYRARDTRLNRDVAIKVLPELFAGDPERLTRFTREAQTLASLNHPNIAAIYGLEEVPGNVGAHGRALVMELVDGEDLSAVVSRGPMPVDDAITVARQVLDALEAAHENGIVHRDLKPANIKVRTDGTVKVLDFGLAKMRDPATLDSGPGTLANSPTLTAHATQMGLILGTAAYMSPEQARGKPVDKRTDVWAFGCVLFEMLTGRRAFDGEDATEVISAVVKTEPDWQALPAAVPGHLRDIVTRCLVKDRKERVPDVSVVRYMLDGRIAVSRSTGATSATTRTPLIWKAAAAVCLMLALAAGLAWYRARSVPPPLARFLVYAPENTTFAAGRRMATMAAVSPDGRTLAFTVADTSGKRLLWLRPIDSLTPRPLPGTDGASYPFWSPDNQWIAYMTDGKLMKVSAAGGQPVELCAAPSSAIVGRGGAWSRDNVIVFNNGPGPLHRISASGGQAQPVGGAAPPGVGNFTFPSFLPDGRHVLAYANAPVEDQQGLYVVSLDTGESKRILSADSGAIYAPEAGRLLYVRQGALLAHRFDPTTFAANGDPITVAERVEHTVVPGVVAFSLSNTGVLAYGTADPSEERYQLEWIARDGTPKESVGQPSPYMGLDLSPDGRHVAVHLHDAGGDIWVMEVSTGRTIKFTANVSQDSRSPVWSRKGDRIAYASRRDGKWGIYVKPWNAAGDEERVFESDGKALLTVQPWSWAPGDDSIVQSMYDNKVQTDLYRLPLSGDRQPTPLVRSPALDVHGQISPDGKWLAYMSLETGEARIYVQSLSSTARWPVSSGGGVMPRWRGDGHELFYLAGTSMMAVDVTATGSVFESGKPHTLFEHGSTLGQGNLDHLAFSYAVDREGQRFLIARKPANERREQKPPIAVVLNWAEGLKLQ